MEVVLFIFFGLWLEKGFFFIIRTKAQNNTGVKFCFLSLKKNTQNQYLRIFVFVFVFIIIKFVIIMGIFFGFFFSEMLKKNYCCFIKSTRFHFENLFFKKISELIEGEWRRAIVLDSPQTWRTTQPQSLIGMSLMQGPLLLKRKSFKACEIERSNASFIFRWCL